jgi:hypothetical protein
VRKRLAIDILSILWKTREEDCGKMGLPVAQLALSDRQQARNDLERLCLPSERMRMDRGGQTWSLREQAGVYSTVELTHSDR